VHRFMLVDLPGAGSMKPTLFELLRPILEDWIGGQIPLVPSSIYGVRVYTKGSALQARHCVRAPAVGLRRVNSSSVQAAAVVACGVPSFHIGVDI